MQKNGPLQQPLLGYWHFVHANSAYSGEGRSMIFFWLDPPICVTKEPMKHFVDLGYIYEEYSYIDDERGYIDEKCGYIDEELGYIGEERGFIL